MIEEQKRRSTLWRAMTFHKKMILAYHPMCKIHEWTFCKRNYIKNFHSWQVCHKNSNYKKEQNEYKNNGIILSIVYFLYLKIVHLQLNTEEMLMHKKDWERPECDCCRHYSYECIAGACFWYPNDKRIPREKSGWNDSHLFLPKNELVIPH